MISQASFSMFSIAVSASSMLLLIIHTDSFAFANTRGSRHPIAPSNLRLPRSNYCTGCQTVSPILQCKKCVLTHPCRVDCKFSEANPPQHVRIKVIEVSNYFVQSLFIVGFARFDVTVNFFIGLPASRINNV